MLNPTLWIATVPPHVLTRPTPVQVVTTEDGYVEVTCPLCGLLFYPKACDHPQEATCRACGIALDWTAYTTQRQAQLDATERKVRGALDELVPDAEELGWIVDDLITANQPVELLPDETEALAWRLIAWWRERGT